MPRPRKPRPAAPPPADAEAAAGPLRIIGGEFRGRKLVYSGRADTRPMKDRVREAMFNLIGPAIRGCHAIDLFAGTGAIALEALSRGAVAATLIERHIPTAKLIRENIEALGATDRCRVVSANALIWTRQPGTLPAEQPWAVFISPPWEMFATESEAMLDLIRRLVAAAPAESLIVVEADERFDFSLVPDSHRWRVRAYPPAVLGIWETPAPASTDEQ